jgi:hypothetical protein
MHNRWKLCGEAQNNCQPLSLLPPYIEEEGNCEDEGMDQQQEIMS